MKQPLLNLGTPPRELVVACTGHRPDDRRPWHGVGTWRDVHIHTGVQRWLGEQLDQLLEQASQQGRKLRAVSGFAVGVDTWYFQEALRRGIATTAAIPFVGQERTWPIASQKLYHELLARADEVVNVGNHFVITEKDPPLQLGEVRKLMHARDRYMVNRCHLILEVWDGSPGGTGATVRYAVEAKREARWLDPRTLRG